MGFSNLGWSCWNDRFRNAFKGKSHLQRLGAAFGRHGTKKRIKHLDTWLRGSLDCYPGGIVYEPMHSVNYVTSHDGFTLGDYIRQAERAGKEEYPVTDLAAHLPYSPTEEKIAKLMAIIQMLTPGIPMIHAGQEWGRGKIIRSTYPDQDQIGYPDSNSYNKDDATNYLDFNEIELNQSVFDFYQRLIRIRKQYPVLAQTQPKDWHLQNGGTFLQKIFDFHAKDGFPSLRWLINMEREKTWRHPADGKYMTVISTWEDHSNNLEAFSDYQIPPLSSLLLIKLRD
jgi:pullulanase/glycogen debranching enzyme